MNRYLLEVKQQP